jgi:hypothetical protein
MSCTPFQNSKNYGEHDKRKVHETGNRVESQLKYKKNAEMSKQGWLIGFVMHATWVYSSPIWTPLSAMRMPKSK